MAALVAPSVSVVITSFNQRALLAEAIESVLRQSLPPLEIIVADDASSDGSQALIEEFAAKYPGLILPVLQPRNLGVARNRNSGLARARGGYITLLDGDDRSDPRKHERELAALAENRWARIAYSNVWLTDQEGHRTSVRTTEPQPSGDIFRAVFSRTFPHLGTTRNEMVASECYREVGLHDSSFVFFDDWDLRVRLTRRFRVVYCPAALNEYRKHPWGLSAHTSVGTHYAEMRAVIRKNLPLLEGLTDDDVTFIRRAHAQQLAPLVGPAAREAVRCWRPRLLAECVAGWMEYRGAT
jgi:glycosyltransferase involved in cell wall biosynthesis